MDHSGAEAGRGLLAGLDDDCDDVVDDNLYPAARPLRSCRANSRAADTAIQGPAADCGRRVPDL
ncbi:MAG: hypothetical protein R3B70_08450 [Polyangiaceae bacterium]